MKIIDRIRSERCAFCKTTLINQKVYVARERICTGFVSAFSSDEPKLLSAVDCPRCGKQKIIGEYYREYIPTRIKNIDNSEKEADNEVN